MDLLRNQEDMHMSLDGFLVNKWLFDYMGCLIYKDLYSFYYGMPEFVSIQNLKNIQ